MRGEGESSEQKRMSTKVLSLAEMESFMQKKTFFFNVDSEIERNIGKKRKKNSTSFSLVNFRLI